MSSSIAVVVLAAGKGTRLKVETPKPLLKTLGKPLLSYVMDNIQKFSHEQNSKIKPCLVIGHKKENILQFLQDQKYDFSTVLQEEQKGTGHALKIYLEQHKEASLSDWTFITCADAPLIDNNVFKKLWNQKENQSALAASFFLANPTGYGRILRSDKGFAIVEEKEATLDQKKIQEVNSGFYLLRTSYLIQMINKLENKNSTGEYYLTDLFRNGENVEAIVFENDQDFLGINTFEQLEEVTKILTKRKLSKLMQSGVNILQADSCYVESSVECEAGSVIYPNTTLLGNTKIGKNVIIESNCFIKDSVINEGCQVLASSYIEGAIIHKDASIGPMARIRPQSIIGEKSKVGNFVEIKKSQLDKNVKISHLSYVGDATIGENTNIGCGFITCNYDGAHKHQTTIGRDSFIGSDCQVVAPISIGDEAFIAAGSTITKSVPDKAFAISRSQQVTKENLAFKFLKK